MIFKKAPPQRPGLAAKNLDDLWQWCQGKIDAGANLGAEAKLDGLRCLASKCSDDVRINFQADQDLAGQHPELIEAVSKAPFDSLILDGVALAVDEGRILSSDHLSRLPTGEPGFPALLVCFDCLYLDEDLGARPLGERREILAAAVHDMDSPLVQLSASRKFSCHRELEILNRWALSRPGSEGLMVKDLQEPRQRGISAGWAVLQNSQARKAVAPRLALQVQGRKNALAAFVIASPSEIEAARGLPLAGEGRRFFRKAYLEPAGLQEEDITFLCLVPRVLKRAPRAEEVQAWSPWLMRQLGDLSPQLVVALGKQAALALNDLADLAMPHPHAVLRHGDSGEVARKAGRLKELLSPAQVINNCGYNKGGVNIAGKAIRCSIFKADEERHLVYGVIAEPDTVDAQGDVMSALTIEELAHDYMLNSRKFDDRHDERSVDAAPVESWIQREDAVLFGERIRAGSWVIGVKVFAEGIWQKVRDGEYRAFSIGGEGVRVPRAPRVRFE